MTCASGTSQNLTPLFARRAAGRCRGGRNGRCPRRVRCGSLWAARPPGRREQPARRAARLDRQEAGSRVAAAGRRALGAARTPARHAGRGGLSRTDDTGLWPAPVHRPEAQCAERPPVTSSRTPSTPSQSRCGGSAVAGAGARRSPWIYTCLRAFCNANHLRVLIGVAETNPQAPGSWPSQGLTPENPDTQDRFPG